MKKSDLSTKILKVGEPLEGAQDLEAAQNRVEQRMAERLNAVNLRDQGKAVGEIAGALGRHVNTVRRWLRLFDAGGVERLRYEHKGGRARKLSPSQIDRLGAWVVEGSPSGSGFTLKELAARLAAEFGVHISQQQISQAVSRLGLSHRLSRPRRRGNGGNGGGCC